MRPLCARRALLRSRPPARPPPMHRASAGTTSLSPTPSFAPREVALLDALDARPPGPLVVCRRSDLPLVSGGCRPFRARL
eukprot:256500-Alexandrium_andersonii.AAC.1